MDVQKKLAEHNSTILEARRLIVKAGMPPAHTKTKASSN
jgi:hypothetical protein